MLRYAPCNQGGKKHPDKFIGTLSLSAVRLRYLATKDKWVSNFYGEFDIRILLWILGKDKEVKNCKRMQKGALRCSKKNQKG